MFPQRVNERSIRAGGNTTRSGEWDGMGALSCTPVVLNDTVYVFYRGIDMRETAGGEFQLSMMSTPLADFGKPGWKGDWRTNPLVDTPDVLAATEPGLTATAAEKWGDMHAINVAGTVYLYVMIAEAGQRLVRFTFDPVTPALNFDGECLWNGGIWGSNIAAIYHHNGNFFFAGGVNADDPLLGNGKRVRRSATGLGDTWTGQNDIMQPTGVDGEIDRYSHVTGRGWQDATYAYMLVPSIGTVDHPDWPEGMTLFRTPLSLIDQTDNTWEKYPRPVMLRDPTEGGTWQLSFIDTGDGFYGLYQMWGINDLGEVGSQDMLDCRDTPYSGNDDDMFPTTYKSVMVVEWGSRLALEDWDAVAVPAGRYRIQNVKTGLYMVATDTTEDALVEGSALTGTDRDLWDISDEVGFSLLTNVASNKILRVRDDGRGNNKFCAVFDSPGTGSANYAGQWMVSPVHDVRARDGSFISGGRLVQITNRYSSLRIKFNESGDQLTQRKDAHGTDGWWRLLQVV
ncbi:hypothetical protein Q5Y75_05630 [Ruegeria sp. 2205SS24-7]|uniref:RICIN domain-containing protein n=1 Tax=Ruegeria discodermiae TaxID=3064389 RepID=UPI0027426035|nr:RICIN domain-containing protein [Ruegeria sp. 2205SS24-7]MDP5216691.1 hypothetical protein [Ruegeria sp. 2205SS24-7]